MCSDVSPSLDTVVNGLVIAKASTTLHGQNSPPGKFLQATRLEKNYWNTADLEDTSRLLYASDPPPLLIANWSDSD